MVTTLLTVVLLSAPPAPSWQLDCHMIDGEDWNASSGIDATGHDIAPTPVSIRLDVRGRRIASVVIDGPPILSSYAGLQSFTGSQDSSGAVTVMETTRSLPRQLRWRGTFEGNGLRLRRGDSEIWLTPDPAQGGAYSGSWRTHDVFEGHIHIDGGGAMRCPAAASQDEGTPGS